jgi:sugar/nucleoside kinase (ribokinase family)
MIGYRGANESLTLTDSDLRGPIDWLHISGYMLLNADLRAGFRGLVEEANRLAIPCSVDLEGIAQAGLQIDLRGVTVVLCNRDEFRTYFRTDSVGQQGGIDVLVVKSGVLGCRLAEAGKETDTLIHGLPAVVVDLTGAGDAFNAGLIAARLAGAMWPEACRRANELASRKVAQRGPHL